MSSNKEKFLSALNAENPPPVVFTVDNVNISNPVTEIGAGWNTKVTISAKPNSGYVGSVDVTYKRVDLVELGAEVGLSQEAPFTVESFLTLLNKTKGSSIQTEDVETFAIPLMETGVIHSIPLKATITSLGWIGETDVAIVIGIPAMANRLHKLLHTTMPAPGYL